MNSGEFVVQLRFRLLAVGCGLERFLDREDYRPPEFVRDRLLRVNFLQEKVSTEVDTARRSACATALLRTNRPQRPAVSNTRVPGSGTGTVVTLMLSRLIELTPVPGVT